MGVVHGVVAGKNACARQAQVREVNGVRLPADQPRRAPAHDAAFDPFLPRAPRLVGRRALGHHHRRDAVLQSPAQGRQRRRIAPAGDNHRRGPFPVQQGRRAPRNFPRRSRRTVAAPEQRRAPEGVSRLDLVPGILAGFRGFLHAQQVEHPCRRRQPRVMVGAEPVENDGDAPPDDRVHEGCAPSPAASMSRPAGLDWSGELHRRVSHAP